MAKGSTIFPFHWVKESIASITKKQDEMSKNVSHVGMVIHTTTLDTMDKVIAIYGGTTWVKIEGMFLLGQSDEYAINSTGGEATHTLTTDEIPSHCHNGLYWVGASSVGLNSGSGTTFNLSYSIGGLEDGFTTGYTGDSQAHNNMPPYKTVYIWERTE